MFQVGLENFLSDESLVNQLKGRKVAYMGHPSSTDQRMNHGMDLLMKHSDLQLSAAFGPQHGMKGDKQDNMVETEDFVDPVYGIPVYSLYGKVRRPTPKMLESFDVLLFDLQDVGCRIYTYLTSLIYLLEDCSGTDKEIWVLDRPNPAGRPVEGFYLDESQKSFVGAARLPMRHGLTLGEVALWYQKSSNFDVKVHVVKMKDYFPEESPGYGWPLNQFSWVNPSPNLSNPYSARVFCGTVLFEGTKLSEGRGTTRALEQFGAPDWDGATILAKMKELNEDWLKGVLVRPCYFEPTFQKLKGQLCGGVALHGDNLNHYRHTEFRPFRLCSLFLRTVRELYPKFDLWQMPPYEYETEKIPVDMLSGTTYLRNWVDHGERGFDELDQALKKDENDWLEARASFLQY